MHKVRWLSLVLTGFAAFRAAAAWITPRAYEDDLATPFAHRRAPWTTSETCRACHPDQYASWHRTFHRTMTQEADRRSVVGAFDGRTVTYAGVPARPVEKNGGYAFEFGPGSGLPRTVEVVRTVGSRRYQQYLARLPGIGDGDGGNLYRLPLLWHIGDRRWVHMNGVFLGADGRDYNTHLGLWNQNCIFCHNTGPEPGLTNYDAMVAASQRGEAVNSQFDARHDSSVAELGIACESCHGPGGEHARRNRNPFRRYLLHLTGRDDPTIVHPAKLDQQRSVDVCGQCHGQRVPPTEEALVEWITDGPTYRAGERLDEHVRSVWRDSRDFWGTEGDRFRLRFWGDGTARLTAYEYQGVEQSPCFARGELTCLSCHTLHDGDVRGQLPPEHRGNTACLACHRELARDVKAHTFHEPAGSGSSCYGCHMPKMVYGIMEIHRSHRIENPIAARDAAAARPHACTSCHLDKSLVWSARAAAKWWGTERHPIPAVRTDGAGADTVDVVASLLAGDPVQRAVAAHRAGRDDTPLSPAARAFLIPHLLTAMEDDYPAVRRFAARSLMAIVTGLEAAGFDADLGAELAAFDFLADKDVRGRWVTALSERWRAAPKQAFPAPPPGSLLDAEYQPLRRETWRLLALGRARSQDIHIGE